MPAGVSASQRHRRFITSWHVTPARQTGRMHQWARLGLSAETPRTAVRIVQALVLAEFLQGLGASAVLPLLPLYLRDHGTTVAVVGAVMGAYFVAGVLTQYGAGYLTDRIGHRVVILTGLVTYAVASVCF